LRFDLRFSFKSTKPEGDVNLRFSKGKIKNIDSLVWESIIKSNYIDISNFEKNIAKWILEGHKLTDDWFFKLIKGDLFRRFK
jgi:uncharacterized protein (TIGR04255 family)